MPDFTITAPDGRVFDVTAPEGVSQQDVLARVRAHAAQNVPRETPAETPSRFMDFIKSIPTGMVEGVAGTLSASGKAAALESSMEGMEDIPSPEQLTKMAGRILPPLHDPTGRAGQYGASIGRALGDPSTYLGPGGLARKAITGVGGAVGSELGGQLTKDSIAGRVIGGVAGGLVPGAAGGAARRIAAPTPMRDPARAGSVAILRGRGIEPSAGDISGRGGLRATEELGGRILGGGSYERIKNRPLHELTAAVTEDMGASTPRIVPDAPGVPGTISQTENRLGAVFEDTARRLPVTHDNRFGNDLVNIRTSLFREGLPDVTINRVLQQIENVQNGFVTYTARGVRRPRGAMSGETYQALTRRDTPLGRAMRDPDVSVAHYAKRIRDALDSAMDRTVDVAVRNAFSRGRAGGAAQARAVELAGAQNRLREARRQWYVKEVVQDTIARAGPEAASGLILPKYLQAALTRGGANKKTYARAQNQLQQLARAASEVLTPARKLTGWEQARTHGIPGVAGAVLGSGLGHPLIGTAAGMAAPGLVGRAANTRIMQDWLKRQRAPATPTHPVAAVARGAYQGRPRPKRTYGGTDDD